MSDVTINYKGSSLATMDASGTKTLLTEGKYCEDDIEVVYDKPAGPSGTKQIAITQNGTTTEDVAAYASAEIAVNVSGGGGGNPTAGTNDVVFIDYDGSVCYSYSASDFAALTALPANPTHDGLTPDGWNWDLANAKAYVAKFGELVIGQTHTPTDGKFHFGIRIEVGSEIYFGIYSKENNNSVTVDWGDGSATETFTCSKTTYSWPHTYATPGDYDIKVSSTGTIAVYRDMFHGGASASNHPLRGAIRYIWTNDKFVIDKFPDGAYKICLANKATDTLGSFAAYDIGLEGFVLPKLAYSSGGNSNWFAVSSPLRYVSYPQGFSGVVRNYNYSGASNLLKICPDESNANWQTSAFNNCYSLLRINVPACVTDIGASTFNNCLALQELHFRGTTPPAVANSNAFNGIPTTCKIYVPTGYLTAYTGATNYPSSSTYAYVEE